MSQIKPDLPINCAAYTAVDKAESEIELADVLIHQVVAIMFDLTFANECKFIHVSTDYVFDGSSNIALSEDAPNGPINVNGNTKLAGENASLKVNPLSIVIRISWVYSSFCANFVSGI